MNEIDDQLRAAAVRIPATPVSTAAALDAVTGRSAQSQRRRRIAVAAAATLVLVAGVGTAASMTGTPDPQVQVAGDPTASTGDTGPDATETTTSDGSSSTTTSIVGGATTVDTGDAQTTTSTSTAGTIAPPPTTASPTPHPEPQPETTTTTAPPEGSDAEPLAGIEMSLADAKALWAAKRPPAYTYIIDRLCYCAPNPKWEVNVLGDAIVSDRPIPGSGGEAAYPLRFTVDDLYATASAVDPAQGSVRVWVDEAGGFPTEIRIDHITMAVDDEETYRTWSFVAHSR